MKTIIFADYQSFLMRYDKSLNGVSPEFAEEHPDYEKDNETNNGCWCCVECVRCDFCEGCVDCVDCEGCDECEGCEGCEGCKVCAYCVRCVDCVRCKGCNGCKACVDCDGCDGCWCCVRCVDCVDCEGLKNNSTEIAQNEIKIENIHAAVLAAATSTPDALDMSDWHTCGTTHCRAGWVVHLAGEEGYKLEKETSTLFAAMQIYKASSDIRVSPTRFYETNEQGLADMKRCAELESGLNTNEVTV